MGKFLFLLTLAICLFVTKISTFLLNLLLLKRQKTFADKLYLFKKIKEQGRILKKLPNKRKSMSKISIKQINIK